MKKIVLLIFVGLLSLITIHAQSDCGSCDEKPTNKKERVTTKGVAKANFTIYPNPATDYIGITNGKGIARIHLYNLVGRKMKSFHVSDESAYYVGDLPIGIYLVQLISNNNKIITTQRINKK